MDGASWTCGLRTGLKVAHSQRGSVISSARCSLAKRLFLGCLASSHKSRTHIDSVLACVVRARIDRVVGVRDGGGHVVNNIAGSTIRELDSPSTPSSLVLESRYLRCGLPGSMPGQYDCLSVPAGELCCSPRQNKGHTQSAIERQPETLA